MQVIIYLDKKLCSKFIVNYCNNNLRIKKKKETN